MQTENKTDGFAARVLRGARDLVWQDDPAARKPSRELPVDMAAPVDMQKSAQQPAQEMAANPLFKELLDTVMSRPTAYSAFAEAIAALSDVPMDEATRYRSAFAILSRTQQRSVEQIVQAVDVHAGALESEALRFGGQSKSVEEEEIAARIREADALNADIAQAALEISALREETEVRIRRIEEDMAQKRLRAAELGREAESKRQTILQTERAFAAAAASVKTRLADEKEKIRKLLGK